MIAGLLLAWAAAAEPAPCREHPDLAGACYPVRGRLSLYLGNPSRRIWIVGTDRLLGVSEGRFARADVANIPPDLVAISSFDQDVFGDFLVCPFTPDEPGVMRLVCVESVSNAVVREAAARRP